MKTAELLGLRPEHRMMVAAYNDNLVAASALGFQTACVYRPTEYGPNRTTDFTPGREWHVVAEDFSELADRLSC